jgi:hypothetical protein
MKLEVASGFEPLSRGFADLRLNHLATPPLAGQTQQYRGRGVADQPLTLDGARPRNVEFPFGRAGIAQW